MSRCPDKETLERFAYGRLPDTECANLEVHLESCRRCAAALARLPVGEELLERIRELERSRQEIAESLSRLPATEDKLASTVFGREDNKPRP